VFPPLNDHVPGGEAHRPGYMRIMACRSWRPWQEGDPHRDWSGRKRRAVGRVRRAHARTVVLAGVGAGLVALGIALTIPPMVPPVPPRPDALVAACLSRPGCVRPFVVGHKGAPSLRVPSNSLASFQRATALGANVVEVDVRFSSDGVPVVVHEETIPFFRSPGCAGKLVSRTPAAELAQCRLFPSPTQRIPPLEDLIRWARGRTMIQIDLKDLDKIGLLAERLRRLDAGGFCYLSLTVWHAGLLRGVLERFPELPLSLRIRTVKQFEDVLAGDRLPQVFMVEIDTTLDRPVAPDELERLIARTHSAGLKVLVSGSQVFGSEESHLKLFRQGYDAVLSYDVPNGVEAARRFERESPRRD
jgi:glycerophosphoryl diester phosphodiesterase